MTEPTPENLRELATSYAAQRDSVYMAAIVNLRAAADRIEELEAVVRALWADAVWAHQYQPITTAGWNGDDVELYVLRGELTPSAGGLLRSIVEEDA